MKRFIRSINNMKKGDSDKVRILGTETPSSYKYKLNVTLL